MFRVLYKHLLLRHHISTTVPTTTTHHFNLYGAVFHPHNPHLKSISGIPENPIIPTSFTEKYLINSCGLPPESKRGFNETQIARLFSKKWHLFSPIGLSFAQKYLLNSIGLPPEKTKYIYLSPAEKPDSVISFLKNNGFAITQIAGLISKDPSVLYFDPNNFVKPKLDFFLNLGASHSEVADFIVSHPNYLDWKLQDGIIPSFNFLKRYIDDNAVILSIFKRWPDIIYFHLESRIPIFREHGVPECNIIKLLISSPRTFGLSIVRYNEIFEVIKKIGIDPSSPRFLFAFRTVAGMSKSRWEKKLAICRNELRWSENDILFMLKSNPQLFTLSLEKRAIPRSAVLGILKSKGIIGEELKVTTILKLSEKGFMEKYVTKYQEQVPEVMEAYKKGGSEFVELGTRDMEGEVV
ncbi:Mitochodrial transcription termination factor-related [Macleaya cordata]|uniref:Mitochodrial transcription termination factor-related n=1 Tax=Macleaya cordata TaxID=56857 RepID=A0A200Q1R5_MACCD|nr:Mitochodrial transcription termination factor-related [Macleaya cordata]